MTQKSITYVGIFLVVQCEDGYHALLSQFISHGDVPSTDTLSGLLQATVHTTCNPGESNQHALVQCLLRQRVLTSKMAEAIITGCTLLNSSRDKNKSTTIFAKIIGKDHPGYKTVCQWTNTIPIRLVDPLPVRQIGNAHQQELEKRSSHRRPTVDTKYVSDDNYVALLQLLMHLPRMATATIASSTS
jgi:hypothetical protein